MAEPATGTVAATTALVTTSASMFGLGSLMPPGASPTEFVWGIFFSILGAASYQFIEAFAARQQAAADHVPVSERPTIDIVLLGYAMCGGALSAAVLILGIHEWHGTTGFGDPTWLQSAAGFMVAGPVGPKIVIKAVAAITAFISSRIGGLPK